MNKYSSNLIRSDRALSFVYSFKKPKEINKAMNICSFMGRGKKNFLNFKAHNVWGQRDSKVGGKELICS